VNYRSFGAREPATASWPGGRAKVNTLGRAADPNADRCSLEFGGIAAVLSHGQ
jgi:hypothetical protein